MCLQDRSPGLPDRPRVDKMKKKQAWDKFAPVSPVRSFSGRHQRAQMKCPAGGREICIGCGGGGMVEA